MTGCATTKDPDPFETVNRRIFAFNEGLDQSFVKPIAQGYDSILPGPLTLGIHNFFSNLNDIGVVANDLLQLKFKQAAFDTGRFLINSSIGLLGLVDVASELNLPKHEEDLSQTLAYWGVGNGPYMILPFFGSSTVRDTVGWGMDTFLDPLYYAGAESETEALTAYGIKNLDTRAQLLSAEKILQSAALDKYSYLRDAYLSRREYLVYDGQVPEKEVDDEDLFDDDDLFEEDDLFDDEQ